MMNGLMLMRLKVGNPTCISHTKSSHQPLRKAYYTHSADEEKCS